MKYLFFVCLMLALLIPVVDAKNSKINKKDDFTVVEEGGVIETPIQPQIYNMQQLRDKIFRLGRQKVGLEQQIVAVDAEIDKYEQAMNLISEAAIGE